MSPAAAVVLILVVSMAQANEGTALELCNMDATRLKECLPAIRGPKPSLPTAACCNAVRTADLRCLCGYKDSLILRSVGVDPKLAVALPAKCDLPTPPECRVKSDSP